MTKIDPSLGEYLPHRATLRECSSKTRRTVSRWIAPPDGLPHLQLGTDTYIPLPEAREWIASKVKRPNQRRGARE